MIPFNKPNVIKNELRYIQEAIDNAKLSGDGQFTKKCQSFLEAKFSIKKALLTHSCTAAIEMAAILANIKSGDEVIMPSFTFVSTANPFLLRGAVPVFIDIKPSDLNIDENLIETAITKKTKAIVPVHYAGVACEMEKIMKIAKENSFIVIEDAAQAVNAKYKNRALGTIGHLGTYSFHDTKNFISGEGGALCINDEKLIERAEIIREKGTNRAKFLKGEIDKYTWVDIGSSFLPSELTAAFLFGQLENMDTINKKRLNLYSRYKEQLLDLENQGLIRLPQINSIESQHNGHMFYIICESEKIRDNLIFFLKSKNIQSVFHYIPLHSSPAGKKYGKFYGSMMHTDKLSRRLIRLPMYLQLSLTEVDIVANRIKEFFKG